MMDALLRMASGFWHTHGRWTFRAPSTQCAPKSPMRLVLVFMFSYRLVTGLESSFLKRAKAEKSFNKKISGLPRLRGSMLIVMAAISTDRNSLRFPLRVLTIDL